MKMILVPISEDRPDLGGAGTIRSTIEREGFVCHEVELDPLFDLRSKLLEPKYQMGLAVANLSILAIAFTAFADALTKDRELDS